MKIDKKTSISLLVFVVLCLLVGYVGSLFQEDALLNWYPTLDKSPLTPPSIAFPIVWTILYIMMGVSITLIVNGKNKNRTVCYKVFSWQLIANFMWSILFFHFENPLWGLVDIVVLDLLAILYAFLAFRFSRWASILFVPYIVWLLFATYLNGYI